MKNSIFYQLLQMSETTLVEMKAMDGITIRTQQRILILLMAGQAILPIFQ